MNASTSKPSSVYGIFLAIFLLAWAVRYVFLLQMSGHPAFAIPVVDAGEYHDLAAKMATGVGRLDKLAWQPWFYPVVLSWVYIAFGISIWAAKVFQITAGALACTAIAALGLRLGGRRLGWVSGIIAVLYGPMIAQDGELLAETWAALWMALTALTALRARNGLTSLNGLALGALGALCLFTRPPLVLAWGAAVAWLFIMRFAKPPPNALGPARSTAWGLWLGLVVLGALVTASPFLLAIQNATGTVRLLPTTGGINFYIGNSEDPCRTINIRPGYQWEKLTQWPVVEGYRSPAEQDAFFYAQAREAIRNNPATWMKHLGIKTAQFFSSREIPRNIEIYALRDQSTLLAALVWKWRDFGFPFGLLAGLFVVGLVFRRAGGDKHPLSYESGYDFNQSGSRGRKTAALMLLLMLLAYAVGIILIHVCDRYRIPVLPLMLPLAGMGALILWDTVRARQWVAAAGSLVVIAALAVLTSLPGPFCAEQLNYRAELDRIMSTYAFKGRNLPLAETYARSALVHDPNEAHAWNQLGLIQATRGDIDQAAAYFEEAVARDPDMAVAWFNLARVALSRENPADAVAHFQRGLTIMPGHLQARLDLGDTWLKLGDRDQARVAFEEVLRIMPGYPPALQRIQQLGMASPK